METKFLEVMDFGFRSVINDEVRFEILEFFFARTDEHVADEMGLPGNFDDEANGHTGIFVSTAESIDDKQTLATEFLDGEFFNFGPGFFAHGVVVVRIFGRIPPHGVLRIRIDDDIFVFGRTTSEDAGHDVDGTKFGHLALFITFEGGFRFFLEKHFVGGVIDNFRCPLDAIGFQIRWFKHV